MLEHILGESLDEELELFSPVVVPLIRKVLALGAPMPVAGHETKSGAIIEAAWPNALVGVTLGDDERRDTELVLEGWEVFSAHGWVAEELVARIEARS